MEQEKLWAVFQQTGKVEDYLRYCGIDIYTTGVNSTAEEHGETANEDHHRRSHRERKQ